MILVVVFCFFTCWCPFFVCMLISQHTTLLTQKNFIFSLLLIHLCGFANSFMNPVIYALMSQTFRNGFWEILTVCCPQYRGPVKGSGNRTEHRSVTAVSQTEIAERNQAKKGYARFFRRESTQLSGVSDPEDDRIALSRIDNKTGSRSLNNDGKLANNKIVQDAERKQRAERLLHKFLDEDLPRNTRNPNATDEIPIAVSCTSEAREGEVPLINKEKGFQTMKHTAVYHSCNHDQNDLVNEDELDGQTNSDGLRDHNGRDNPVNHIQHVQSNPNRVDPNIPSCSPRKISDDQINEDVPDARAYSRSGAIPQISIQHTSTRDVDQFLEDNGKGSTQNNTNGTISNNITAKF